VRPGDSSSRPNWIVCTKKTVSARKVTMIATQNSSMNQLWYLLNQS